MRQPRLAPWTVDRAQRFIHNINVENCLRTGFRSAMYYVLAFGFWYGTGWGYGFLIVVVPLIFSITFSRLPHPEIVAWKVFLGMMAALPPSLLVFVILAEAPSAFELLILTAMPPLFFCFMGYTNPPRTFAYCLGAALSYMVLLFPDNAVDLDCVFAIERCMAMAFGSLLLSMLYVCIPPVEFKDRAFLKVAYARIARRLGSDGFPRNLTHALNREVGRIVDLASQVSPQAVGPQAISFPQQARALVIRLILIRDLLQVSPSGERRNTHGQRNADRNAFEKGLRLSGPGSFLAIDSFVVALLGTRGSHHVTPPEGAVSAPALEARSAAIVMSKLPMG